MGRIWQHVELSTEGHNGVFLWLNRNACWGRSKLRCPRAALSHTVTELRLAAIPIWRTGKSTVELGPSSQCSAWEGCPGGSTCPCTHTDRHQAPHTCSSSICTHHPRADRRWPTEHGKKHRAAIWVSLPLIRGTVVTAPGPGHGKAQGQVALRSKHTLHWELTALQEHRTALGQRGREGTALQHSALGSTPRGPEDKLPFSKHKLPGEQHACTPRPLHHHRKASPRQTQAHLVSQPARRLAQRKDLAK